MPGVRVVGTDQAAHPQWTLETPGAPELVEGSVYELPFEPKSFDTIVVKDVLHHLPDPAAAVDAMVAIARRRVLVIEANRYNPVSYVRMVRVAKHDHFSRAKLSRVLGQRQVTVSSIETHVWPDAVEPVGRVHDAILGRVPLLARLRNYNLAIIEL